MAVDGKSNDQLVDEMAHQWKLVQAKTYKFTNLTMVGFHFRFLSELILCMAVDGKSNDQLSMRWPTGGANLAVTLRASRQSRNKWQPSRLPDGWDAGSYAAART